MKSESKKINESVTKKIAGLARLRLTELEIQTFTPQLEAVLEYVESLNSINVEGVCPLYHPFETSTYLREDQVEVFKGSNESFPQQGYPVPPILDRES